MKLHIYLAFILFFSAQFPTHADPPKVATIKGHVVSKGEHLPGVYIIVKSTNLGTVTDPSGHFTLTDIPTGKITLRVQSVGFKPVELGLELKANETKELTLEMQEDLIGLNEVVVTANRSETNRQEAPVIVNVIGPKIFAAANAVCLSEGLNYQPGLRVENNCQNCGYQQVRINGLEGPYSQILIDSRPIYSALSGVYGIEQFPVNMIERVEVVRGGGSALYGSNAIAGTINIITKEPLNNSFDVTENYSLIGGNTNDNNLSMNASFVSESHKTGLNMFVTRRNRGHYDANKDGFSELGKINGQVIGFRSYFKPTEYSKITATYHYMNEFRRGGNKFDLQPHETDITEQTEHLINGGEIAYDLFSHDRNKKLSVYVSAQKTDRNSYYGAQQNLNAYGKTSDLAAVTGLQFVNKFDKFLFAPANFTTGTEYQLNQMHDQMPGYNRDLKQDVKIAGFFAQNEWNAEHFHFLLGARLDKHNLIKNIIISPRTNLLVEVTEKLQWRTSYSTGFRAPQAFDEDLHILAVGGEVMLIQLAENLRTERSQSISTSFDSYYSLGSIDNNLMLEAFNTKLTDVFVVQEIGIDDQGNKLMERRNGSGATVKGINLENRMAINSKYQIQFGATYQQSRYIIAEKWSNDEAVAPIKKMPRSPEVYGYFSITANPVKTFKTYVSGTYTGSMLTPHYSGYITQDQMKKTPSFIDVNLKLGYDFKITSDVKIRLEGGIQNILNSYQSDFDKGEFRDAGYMYGPMKPRTFFAGLKIGNLL